MIQGRDTHIVTQQKCVRTVLSDLLSQALVLVQHGHVEATAREGVLGGGQSRVLAQHFLHLALAGQPDSAVQPLPLVLGTDMETNITVL